MHSAAHKRKNHASPLRASRSRAHHGLQWDGGPLNPQKGSRLRDFREWGGNEHMASATVRRSIWALAAAIVLAGVIFVATPYVASTRIIRDRIAKEIGAWSGYSVEIGAPPVIEIWPRLRAVLTNVTFSDPQAQSAGAVGKVERMEIELSPMAAMRGDAVFTAAHFVRPTLTIDADAQGGLVRAFAGRGRFWAAVERARAAVGQGSQSAAPSQLPSDRFGSMRIAGGQVLIVRDGKAAPLVTGIEASFNWPALNAAVSLAARGVWRGESVTMDLQSPTPLMLLAGGMAPLHVSIESTPLTASFDGTTKLDGSPFLDGRFSLAAASLDRLANWIGIELAGWEKLHAITVSATAQGDARRLKLDQAELQLNGDKASGAIELNFAKAPSLSGSLAFERLKLGELLATLLPLTSQPSGSEARRLSPVTLDLRLSAGQAGIGGFELSDTAATVKIQDGFAAFDILDATAFEGELRAGFRIIRRAEGTVTEVNAAATDVNGSAFGSAIGMKLLVPTGRGSVSLALNGKGADVQSILQTGSGRLTARFGPGALSQFDLAAFMELYGKGGFFPLEQASNGSLAIDGADFEARIVDGVARIEKAEARFGGRRLWASGLASYADSGLALTGGIGPVPAPGSAATEEASFFVGGSWSASFISPTTDGQTAN